jgi:transcription-repair coupling factor (superfamily II helicase)
MVEVREDRLMLTRNGHFIQIDGKFPRVTAPEPGERLREVLRVVRAF